MRHLPIVAACMVALGVATPGQGSDVDLPPPPQYSAVPIPDGQVAAAVAEFDGIVEDVLARTGIPGMAVAVVSGGEVVYAKGFGVREVGRPEPVDADTVFQLASLSKPVGATVVASQLEDGKLDWSTRVVEHLPWFALADPRATEMLTIGDLYAHRSGLPDHAGDDLEDLGFGQREVLERLRFAPLNRFRDSYAYTNFGLTAAAEAVAAAVGTDWPTLSEEAIYRPLGMDRTSSRFADFIASDNRAVPHVKVGDAWEAKYQRQPDAQTPAGGVSSSVNDMAKWMAMVLADGNVDGEPLVPAFALLPAISPQAVSSPPYTPDARASFYGFGFNVSDGPSGRVTLSHSGAFALGAATNFVLIPSADVGIVALGNAMPLGAVESVTAAFADLVQLGEVTRDWLTAYAPFFAPGFKPFGELAGQEPPADPAPARPPEVYAGTYGNDYFGPLEIAAEGEALVLRIGPAGAAYPLEHWTGDRFAFDVGGENAPPGSRSAVDFQMGAEGAQSVTVEFWNQERLGTFTR